MIPIAGCVVSGLLVIYLLLSVAFGTADELTKLKREHALHRKIRNGTATPEDYARCDADNAT